MIFTVRRRERRRGRNWFLGVNYFAAIHLNAKFSFVHPKCSCDLTSRKVQVPKTIPLLENLWVWQETSCKPIPIVLQLSGGKKKLNDFTKYLLMWELWLFISNWVQVRHPSNSSCACNPMYSGFIKVITHRLSKLVLRTHGEMLHSESSQL